MLGRTTSEHLEKSLDSISSPLDESRSFKPTKPGQMEAGAYSVQMAYGSSLLSCLLLVFLVVYSFLPPHTSLGSILPC